MGFDEADSSTHITNFDLKNKTVRELYKKI